MKYLGIDHGGRRIGLAIGDDETHIAMPLEVIEVASMNEAVDAVALTIKEEGVERIVLGLPITMKGEEGPQARTTREFGKMLSASIGIEVIYEDERFSSKQVETLTKEVDAGNKDAIAAMVILQTYLDKLKA